MTNQRPQSSYEKLVASALLILVALAGWGPLLILAWRLPYVERPILFVSLAIAFFALGLIYDAAERLVGTGKGLYAAAIFCSLPAVSLTVTDPGALNISAMMMLSGLALWLAVRSCGAERPYFLGMLTVLLFAASYFYGLSEGVFLTLLFSVVLTVRESIRPPTSLSLLGGALVLGVFAHYAAPLTLWFSMPTDHPPSTASWIVVVVLLPWVSLLAADVARGLPEKPYWWRWPAISVLLGILIIVFSVLLNRGSSAGAALSPALAIIGASTAGEWFHSQVRRTGEKRFRLPVWITAGAILSFVVVGFARPGSLAWSNPARVLISTGLLVALLASAITNLPRVAFAVMFFAGIYFGTELAPRFTEISPVPADPNAATHWSWITGLVGLALISFGIWFKSHYGIRAPRLPATPDREFRFGIGEFRNFSVRTGIWQGSPTTGIESQDECSRIAIFGDVTGAESPLSNRRGGHRVFRTLVREIVSRGATRAIALGDLASSATPLAYRRLRVLLSQIPFPLLVTPGNHDLFDRDQYDAALFHSLFGFDNVTFHCGSLTGIVLNNAWGSLSGRQFEWLERVLREAETPFTFVFCHKPPFDFRSDVFYGMEDRNHAETLHKMFVKYQVTAVFSGHIHSLLSEVRDGVTYIISGGGGSRLVDGHTGHHFLMAELSPESAILRAWPVTGKSHLAEPLLELQFSPRS